MRQGAGCVGALTILIAFIWVSQAAAIGWPEAVGRLTEERSSAQICVASLRKHGNLDQISRGRREYGAAKAHFDGVIAGLIIALTEGGNPESLPTLQAELVRGASGLGAFCKSVDDLLTATPGQKSWMGDAVKEAIEPLIKPLSEAIAVLYADFRRDKAATRLTIRTQLEAAKWPEFDEVKAQR